MKRLIAILFFLPLFAWADNAQVQPLTPQFQGTVTLSCGAASASTALATVPTLVSDVQLEVQNAGTVTVFVEIGGATGLAATVATGYPVLAAQSKVISISSRVTNIACISASGTQTVYATVGRGN